MNMKQSIYNDDRNDPLGSSLKLAAETYRATTKRITGWLEGFYVGKEVTLLTGKYSGRAALIDAVSIEDGEIVFLCMVTRAGTEPADRDFLNTDCASRSYMMYHEFVIMQ